MHSVLEYRDRLLKLDGDLGEEGDVGARIAKALRKAERDHSVVVEVRKTLQEINAMAREILVGVLQNLVVLGKNLKALIEDHGKKQGELILNWRELDSGMEGGIREAMVAEYKRLFHLVQLMQVFVKS